MVIEITAAPGGTVLTDVVLTAQIERAWRTNARVTELLVDALPPPLWGAPIPGAPARTVRMVAAHLHNARTRWIRTLGREHGITAPALVDRRGQLVMVARQSGYRLPPSVTNGLWQWSTRVREADRTRPPRRADHRARDLGNSTPQSGIENETPSAIFACSRRGARRRRRSCPDHTSRR